MLAFRKDPVCNVTAGIANEQATGVLVQAIDEVPFMQAVALCVQVVTSSNKKRTRKVLVACHMVKRKLNA
jgi:hypothetical protein